MTDSTFVTVLYWIHQIVRIVAAITFVLALVVAFTHWGTRKGSISPFGAWARFVRRWGDHALKPIEVRVLRAGGNPQDAPGWLIAASVLCGLVLITSVDWLIGFSYSVASSMQSGTRATSAIMIEIVFNVLKIALYARVIGSWFGIGPYNRWMRPAYQLTDWLIIPIKRLLPTMGMFDFSPLVAIFLIIFLQNLLRGSGP